MPSWARYAVAVYFGLMMSGSLPTQGWAKSPNPRAAPALVKSTQFAPLKQPYRYPPAAEARHGAQHERAPQIALDLLR
ncbi:hypothetical protein OT109_09155 [Phycisphaeraceae bacterium D3-23]